MSEQSQAASGITDTDFFSLLNTERPGLRAIPDAVAAGDYTAARKLFAADLRDMFQPDRLFRIKRGFRGNQFMYPNETIAEAAERILGLELISCGTPHQFEGKVDWFANPTFNQYREWTWQLSRHPEWAILAEQYRVTHDERYAEGFIRLFQSWVQQAIAPDMSVSGHQTLCWRTIETGIRMGGSWQWAVHSFYRSPHFTDAIAIDWCKSIYEHARRLRFNHRTHNWLIMEMNGLAQIGILYPCFRDAVAWRAYAFERLVEELDRQIYPDGLQYELSTNYHQVNINNYQAIWDISKAFDIAPPEAFRLGLERMHTANIFLMMPDKRLPDVNDGRWWSVSPLARRALEIAPRRDDFRWAATEGREGHPPVETSHAFEYGGYIVLRNSWEPEAIWALFDGGPFGYTHQHEDKLNLLLYAYGRLLLTEGGNYAYDTSEMRRYVLSTRAHNTIRVNGQDQNRQLHFHPPVSLTTASGAKWSFSSDYDVVEATYDEGYGPEAVQSVRHERRVIFLKKGAGSKINPFLLVIDRLHPYSTIEHTYQALWHLACEQVSQVGLKVESSDLNIANLVILTAAIPNLEASLVAGQIEPEWQGWKSIKDHQQGQYSPAPTALYSWQASGPSRIVTVLYPLHPQQACPISAIEADSHPNSTAIWLQYNDGQTIKLDELAFR